MSNLEYIRLNKSNFYLYKDFIESSEADYPEALRTDINDYEDITSELDSVCFILLVDGVYAGNIIGSEPTLNDLADMKESMPDGKTIYIYNLLIMPNFQGKGLGFKLMSKFIDVAKSLSYEFVNCNVRINSSYKIAKKFNIIYEKKVENWEDSDEDFIYCVIAL